MEPKNTQERMDAIRAIIKNHQYKKIDGCLIDVVSATVICQVYNACSDENKVKFASCTAGTMARIAFKMIK